MFGAAEPVLPLVDLSGIAVGDALAREWPKTDCIIGNPPFLGSQHIRATRGDTYTEWLKTTFKIGVKDYCVYWFRRAHDHLTANRRAGLVGTNSISRTELVASRWNTSSPMTELSPTRSPPRSGPGKLTFTSAW